MNSNPHRKTRVEDYLSAVSQLSSGGKRATTGDIAKTLGIANGTASGMMRELAAVHLVDLQPYAGVILTDQGRRRLARVLRTRQLLELFLNRTLGMKLDEVAAEAELLEPATSNGLIERINEWLGQPQSDLRSEPILAAANIGDDYSD